MASLFYRLDGIKRKMLFTHSAYNDNGIVYTIYRLEGTWKYVVKLNGVFAKVIDGLKAAKRFGRSAK